jgi:hypothetical protein
MYYVGLIIVAISIGYCYDEITGWLVFGAGFIFADSITNYYKVKKRK